jgi:hypothetical protein
MRKHNSGDDENYRRVAWSTSQLHSDTVKIVRGWMEQDSYAGKATLGGTTRTGFFDWDSSAAPVELDKVFGRRKLTTQHTRTASIPAHKPVVQIAPPDGRPYRNSTGVSIAAQVQSVSQPNTPTANFGWHLSSQTPRYPAPADAPVPAFRPAPVQTIFADEDDDDWGEMVSSPRVDEKHTISDVAHSAKSKLSGPLDTQSTTLDPWPLSDLSVLAKPTTAPESTTGQTSQPLTDFSVLEPSSPLYKSDSLEALNQRADEKMITGQAAVHKATAAIVPRKGTIADSIQVEVPRNESEDNIIVQNILQNLPDLSYMFR